MAKWIRRLTTNQEIPGSTPEYQRRTRDRERELFYFSSLLMSDAPSPSDMADRIGKRSIMLSCYRFPVRKTLSEWHDGTHQRCPSRWLAGVSGLLFCLGPMGADDSNVRGGVRVVLQSMEYTYMIQFGCVAWTLKHLASRVDPEPSKNMQHTRHHDHVMQHCNKMNTNVDIFQSNASKRPTA
ncbi:hypothetical protein BC937DRAFT_86680 [Endogone sp. FLAS-F59071]|nr:hypothetical protein BC937DRAFT_86680 [Endogone sp. FLAS-F59071]|eukprot:RUS19941.1 hypothetical protein BC937DRAFT_86680 [Endogone sp. FLAS-F59071]